MIKTQVIGNLGNDAVTREVNGRIGLNFSVAHNERSVNGDGEVWDRTIWVNCTRWMNKVTDLPKYLKKGTLVHVTGVPNMRIYKNRDNQTAIDFKLKVESLELLSSPKSNENKDQVKTGEGMEIPPEVWETNPTNGQVATTPAA